jgi:cell division transport system ATP-binding protein
VSKVYNADIVALRDISFQIAQGEFMFLVGHSGAGKSTLIRLLIRQELPTQGDILFENINVTHIDRKTLPVYRQNIGVVFQDYKLIDSKTVKENIEFALEITGKSDAEIKETTEYLLEVVKLHERATLFPAQLSGGEKQRAGIARALANDPKLLIADEPTGNLDPDTSQEIMQILERINSWGTTIMIATHDKETVDRLQRRVIRLEKGRIASDIATATYNGHADGTRDEKAENTAPKPAKHEEILSQQHDLEDNFDADDFDTIPISKLGLPKKIEKMLNKENIDTIGKILDLSETDLDNIIGKDKTKKKLIVQEIERFISVGS